MSRGVRFFGISLIVVSILSGVFTFDFRRCIACVQTLPPKVVIVSLMYAAGAAILGVTAGFGLLKRKDCMRKLGIVLSALNLLVSIPMFFFSYRDFRSYVYGAVEYAMETTRGHLNPASWDVAVLGVMVFLFWLTTVYRLAFIIFFSRQRVRKQFS